MMTIATQSATAPLPEPAYPAPLTSEEQRAYDTARNGAIWFESCGRWLRLNGAGAIDSLNGLVTNDVRTLAIGAGMYAAALTSRGRMISDLGMMREREDAVLLLVPECAVEGILNMMRKYINPRLARTTDESALWTTFSLYGSDLDRAVEALGMRHFSHKGMIEALPVPERVFGWPEWQMAEGRIDSAPLRAVRMPDLGDVPGMLLAVPVEHAAAVRASLEALIGALASRNVADVLRIEGGRPMMGIDMDENTIPQEANLDDLRAISYAKGCYTGQETVARVHFRGHVNRYLQALNSPEPLARHAQLFNADGKIVGDVRSTAISPRLGPVAIAMIRREIGPGSIVWARRRAASALGAEASQDHDALTEVSVGSLPFTLTRR